MFARHAKNSFGGLRRTKWDSMADFTIAHGVNISGMKDASGIFGKAEYAKGNEVKGGNNA